MERINMKDNECGTIEIFKIAYENDCCLEFHDWPYSIEFYKERGYYCVDIPKINRYYWGKTIAELMNNIKEGFITDYKMYVDTNIADLEYSALKMRRKLKIILKKTYHL